MITLLILLGGFAVLGTILLPIALDVLVAVLVLKLIARLFRRKK